MISLHEKTWIFEICNKNRKKKFFILDFFSPSLNTVQCAQYKSNKVVSPREKIATAWKLIHAVWFYKKRCKISTSAVSYIGLDFQLVTVS